MPEAERQLLLRRWVPARRSGRATGLFIAHARSFAGPGGRIGRQLLALLEHVPLARVDVVVYQSAARRVPRPLRTGVRRLRVEFVREDRGEAAAVLACYAALIAGRTTADRVLAEVGAVPQQGVSRKSMELSQ